MTSRKVVFVLGLIFSALLVIDNIVAISTNHSLGLFRPLDSFYVQLSDATLVVATGLVAVVFHGLWIFLMIAVCGVTSVAKGGFTWPDITVRTLAGTVFAVIWVLTLVINPNPAVILTSFIITSLCGWDLTFMRARKG